jgi:hypothetical protein
MQEQSKMMSRVTKVSRGEFTKKNGEKGIWTRLNLSCLASICLFSNGDEVKNAYLLSIKEGHTVSVKFNKTEGKKGDKYIFISLEGDTDISVPTNFVHVPVTEEPPKVEKPKKEKKEKKVSRKDTIAPPV